jgi:hypothetical protein
MDLALVLDVSLWICAFLVVAVFGVSVVRARLSTPPDSAVLVAPAVVLLAAALAEMTGWATVVQVFGAKTPFESHAASIVPGYVARAVVALILFVAAYAARIIAWAKPRARRPMLAAFVLLTAGGLGALWATVLPLPLLLGFRVAEVGTLTNASLIGAAALTAVLAARALASALAPPVPSSAMDIPFSRPTEVDSHDDAAPAPATSPRSMSRDSSAYRRPPGE